MPWKAADSWEGWLSARALSLLIDSDDMAEVALDFDADRFEETWHPVHRAALRAELDAGCFHLYEIARQDVDYIMDTFPIVRRKDVARFGSYRTKELILEAYDSMQAAIESGHAHRSQLELEQS